MAKLAAGAVALAADLDVNTAAAVAENAVQNNFIVFLYYRALAASVVYAGYEIREAYIEEGWPGAFKQLGTVRYTEVSTKRLRKKHENCTVKQT